MSENNYGGRIKSFPFTRPSVVLIRTEAKREKSKADSRGEKRALNGRNFAAAAATSAAGIESVGCGKGKCLSLY